MTTRTAAAAPRVSVAPSAALIVAAFALLGVAVLGGRMQSVAGVVALTATALALFHERIFRWQNMLAAILVVILFIPMRRYALPGNLPFQLEPYRVLIGLVGLGWLASLLGDPTVRWRRSVIDWQLSAVLFVSAASVLVNVRRVADQHLTSVTIKSLTFLFSFAIVFYLIVSLVRDFRSVQALLRLLVAGGTVVAFFALVELWTGFNVFNNLHRVFPVLKTTLSTQQVDALQRGGYKRVYASSQHPIALGTLLVLLMPQALYLARATRQRRWVASAAIILLALFGTVSRTSFLCLFVVVVVFLILRPRETLRLWPAVVPLLLAVHLAIPGVLGTVYKSFFPKQGLVAEQADGAVGSSRGASFGPGIHIVNMHPLLGIGYGTRIPQGQPGANSFIVDDQWLSTGMETGILGVTAWLLLFTGFLRKVYGAARRLGGDTGLFFTALGASVTSYVIGMMTYDAFSFIQVTIVMFILLALGSVALRAMPSEETGRAR